MRLDERGKQCPLPVIEAKKALESSAPGEKVEVVVDNEIAVQNLTKMADHKGFAVCSGHLQCHIKYFQKDKFWHLYKEGKILLLP